MLEALLLFVHKSQPLCKSTDLVKWIHCNEALIILFRENVSEVSF